MIFLDNSAILKRYFRKYTTLLIMTLLTICFEQRAWSGCNTPDGTKYVMSITSDYNKFYCEGETVIVTVTINATESGWTQPAYVDWSGVATGSRTPVRFGESFNIAIPDLPVSSSVDDKSLTIHVRNQPNDDPYDGSPTCEKTETIKFTVCKVESLTEKQAADDTTPNSRTTVGVCEKVTFSIKPAITVTWSANAGTPTTGSGTTFSWTAPEVAANATVTATKDTAECEITINAIKPTSAAWKKLDSTITTGYTAGYAGCQMVLKDLTITPETVNFERIMIQEASGPPSNISGYFANNPPFWIRNPSEASPPVGSVILWHRPDPPGYGDGPWLEINASNIAGVTDFAGWPPPGVPSSIVYGGFAAGTFTWAIPMNYRSVVNAAGAGINFATVNQIFTMQANGTLTVTKDDASICTLSRTP